jgi:phosphohistidine phosphatase
VRSLTLLRHAEASFGDETAVDFDRPLNERGRQAARAMGRHLAEKAARFDRILASPARRVVETLQGLATGGWEAGPVEFEPAIYHASTAELLELVRSTANEVRSLMLVGHNPVIGMLALQLTVDDANPLRSRLPDGYPAGALAEIVLDIEHWSEAAPQCGRLLDFIVPGSLRDS